jgi:general secretion pathway protein F
MGAFEYQALTAAGKKQKGIAEGDSPRQVRQQLKDQGLIPLKVEAISGQPKQRTSLSLFSKQGSRLSATDLSLLTRQLATLVRSGMPLEATLATVAEQSERAKVRQVISAVRSKVLEGNTFADSLAEFPNIFNELYRATVAAGESSGKLDAVLEQLADYTENHQQLSQKLISALIYPAVVVTIAIIIVVVMMIEVVPSVVSVFDSSGHELPTLTRMMIAGSNFIQHYGILSLVIIIAGIALFAWRMKDEQFHYRVDHFLLKLPFVRRFIRGLNNERFTRTFSILVGSGVPVLEGLAVAERVVVNRPMRHAVSEAAIKVREGSSIHMALQRSGFFPPVTVHLIASGESSGNLEQMLHQAAINQERELMNTINVMLGILEPLMVLMMGGMILLIVMAIMLPIFNMSDLI